LDLLNFPPQIAYIEVKVFANFSRLLTVEPSEGTGSDCRQLGAGAGAGFDGAAIAALASAVRPVSQGVLDGSFDHGDQQVALRARRLTVGQVPLNSTVLELDFGPFGAQVAAPRDPLGVGLACSAAVAPF